MLLFIPMTARLAILVGFILVLVLIGRYANRDVRKKRRARRAKRRK